MKRFLVLFLVPPAVIDDWKAAAPETREPAERKMREDWMAWTQAHAGALGPTEAAGRTRRVTADGVSETRNDLMLYGFVEAETHEAAAARFADHPHLRIPRSSIEVTEVRAMGEPAR